MTKYNTIGNITQMKRKPLVPYVLDENTMMTQELRRLSPRLRELVDMLEHARPEGSDTEEAFIAQYIDTLPNVRSDAFGNRIVTIGREAPTIAWSSHTDTVHWEEGKQAIMVNEAGDLALDPFSQASCLGADCTAGVWLMRRLILAGKPGLYIFHRSEESGGQGSKWIAKNTPELVTNIKAMIALDRRGYDSVITDQSTGNTASKRFAASLADQLGGCFKPDPTGLFTDSAFYSHLVPECTNVSVGYHDQHSANETLDHMFLDDLLLALLKLDYGKLEVARDHTKATLRSPRSSRAYMGYVPYADYEDGERYYREQWEQGEHGDGIWSASSDCELVDLIRRYPEATAMLLRQWDITERDLYEAISDYEEDGASISY